MGAGRKNWMDGAVKQPGALTKKAQAAGMSTAQFARKHASDPGKTGEQARLAQTFAKYRAKK
jgi:hypothetical protein